jgi:AraC family transcriptional regulator of adaptative response/methylated-DNA-[protein]-cysteine methyltransferase
VVKDDQRWQAVLDRNRAKDGAFVFAVRTTMIYCRPSCPSRRPKRDNVRFFPVPEAAEAHGFRPCRRCRPRDTRPIDTRAALVRRVCREIDARPETSPRLTDLGETLRVSPSHLQRTFKQIIGISPREYAEARRLGSLKTHLRERRSVTEAQYEAGLSSSSRLYERSSGQLGMTPATYRRRGKGAKIVYGFAPCSLGQLLVASTERGICSVKIGDRRGELTAALREEYAEAEIRRDDGGLEESLQTIVELVEGERTTIDLPLDIRATAFQWRVWQLLREIPVGETRTYGELAKSLGAPTAARAVGRACGSNPVAVVIPCHRVVREDGAFGGYKWGQDRKKKLLEREVVAKK